MNETIQTIKTRGQELVTEGNQRNLVFRNKTGKSFFEVSLTVAAAVAAFLFLTGFVSIPLVVVGSVIAYFFGVRVEMLNRLETVEIES